MSALTCWLKLELFGTGGGGGGTSGTVNATTPTPTLAASGTPVVTGQGSVGQVAAVTPVPTLQAAGSAGAQLRVRVVTRLENAAPSRAVVGLSATAADVGASTSSARLAGGNTGAGLPARATTLVLEDTDG